MRKILYFVFVSLLFLFIFVNADSVTGATSDVETTTTVKKASPEKKEIQNKEVRDDTEKKVDSISGATETSVTNELKEETSTTLNNDTLTTVTTTINNVDSITGASDYTQTTISLDTTTTSTTVIDNPTTTTARRIFVISTSSSTVTTILSTATTTSIVIKSNEDTPRMDKEYLRPNAKKSLSLMGEDETKITDSRKKEFNKNEEIKEFDFVKIEKEGKTNIIIFEEENLKNPPTLDYKNHKKEILDKKTIYEEPLFKPETVEDFYLASPAISYDHNFVVKTSNVFISHKIGEEAFIKAFNFLKTNQIKNAKIYFEKLVHYNYRTEESIFYLSRCYFLLKDFIKSINYLKSLISIGLNSNNQSKSIGEYYFHAGNAFYEIENYKDALDNYLESYRFENDNVRIFYYIGLSFYKLNNIEKAKLYWQTGSERGDERSKINYEWLKNK
ncbi:MAG TPA: CDC27 family protein [Spirochaetota bacterium]|nr:CDC27 family protein [Spirochaetota bacterium]